MAMKDILDVVNNADPIRQRAHCDLACYEYFQKHSEPKHGVAMLKVEPINSAGKKTGEVIYCWCRLNKEGELRIGLRPAEEFIDEYWEPYWREAFERKGMSIADVNWAPWMVEKWFKPQRKGFERPKG